MIKSALNMKTYIVISLFFGSILFFIWISLTKEVLVFPMTISLINAVIIVYALLSKYFQHIIFKIYYAYHLMTMILPVFWVALFYPSFEINVFFSSFFITPYDLVKSNFIILLYDLFFIFTVIGIQKFKILKKRDPRFLKYYLFKGNKYFTILFVVILAYTMKLYLISIDAWFMYEMVDLTDYPLANTANVLQKLDILVLLFFAFNYIYDKSKKMLIFMIIIIFISLFFAIISTSKAKLFMVLIPVVLLLLQTKYKKSYLFIVILLFLNSGIVFEFFMYNRLHNNTSLVQNMYDFSNIQTDQFEGKHIKDNSLVVRLGYQFVFAKVIKTYDNSKLEYKADYMNNIIGLIPRVLWPDKPIIGISGNKIGHELGLLGKNDKVTSVGITPLGEAFYELGYLGIAIVPIFLASLITYMALIFNVKYWISYLLSIMLGLSIAIADWHNPLIPTLVKMFIIFYFFGLLLNSFYTDEKRIKF